MRPPSSQETGTGSPAAVPGVAATGAPGADGQHATGVTRGVDGEQSASSWAPERTGRVTCSRPGCGRKVQAGGLCNGHYKRQLRGAPMDGPIRTRRRSIITADGMCSAAGCKRAAVSMGVCWGHYAVERRYGLSPSAYGALFAAQGGVCALCRSADPKSQRGWVVDHNHDTGAVRGILCTACNTAIGAFSDSPERLQAAVDYLRRSPESP